MCFRFALAITLAILCSSFANAAPLATQPNIVLIVADDLGFADVGFQGGTKKTPNLDQLAKNGTILNRHYVNPMCSTTRASLLSGRYSARYGVTGAQNERAYPWGTVTLASALKSVGYDTAITGKWHLGSLPEWGPNKFGFDHSYGSLAGGCEPIAHRYKTGPFSKTWHRNGTLIEEEGHVTDLITKEAVGWLEKRKGSEKPFFLYVPYTAVHIPIDEPKEWVNLYPDITEMSRRHYAACVSHMDDGVGRVIAAVEKIGVKDNTLVIFTSDNGGIPNARNDDRSYPNGDKYPPGPAGGSNGPLHGQKGQLYEGGIRVAALAYWPGVIKPGKCEQVIHATDWVPTLTHLAGYNSTADLKWDGRDVWAGVTGTRTPESRKVYWAGVGFKSHAFREGDLKLIVTGPTNGKQTAELYNLAADPNETKDLAPARPEDLARLRKQLDAEAARDNESRVPAAERKVK